MAAVTPRRFYQYGLVVWIMALVMWIMALVLYSMSF